MTANDRPVFDIRSCGSRPATLVEVASPQGSSFDGLRGHVARVLPGGDLLVRFPLAAGRTIELPFGRSELEIIA